MKTIQVPDEMYAKLMALANEMVKQDPRATRMPHLFQIRTTEEVAAYDGCGEQVWVDDEENKLDEKDIKEKVINNQNWGLLPKSTATRKYKFLDEFEVESILEDIGCRKLNVTNEYRYQNCFFTAKACKQHIKQNDYHYNQPTDYLNHAWRNPEMELVATFLCSLVGKPMYI